MKYILKTIFQRLICDRKTVSVFFAVIASLGAQIDASRYGLTERNVQHSKIKDSSELNAIYLFGHEIGQGGFGTVVEAIEISNDKEWAIKVVVKSMAGPQLKFIQREIRILKLVHHPHIIYLDKVFESPRKIYMVLERCHGELSTLYKHHKPFSEEISKKIIAELLSAVAYLHIHDIVHRDLKMENVLISKNPKDPSDIYYTKLIDFGLSIVKSGSGVESMLDERCGTLVYMSPEMITKEKYSQLCDVWAIGVMLYMLLVGDFPFYAIDEKELIHKISNKEPVIPDYVSLSSKQLLQSLLQKEPVKRITAVEALEHPWIKGTADESIPLSILDQMSKWRSEMMLPDGNSSTDFFGSLMKGKRERGSNSSGKSLLRISSNKQPLAMPVTNIKFNKHQNRVSLEKIPAHVLNNVAEAEEESDAGLADTQGRASIFHLQDAEESVPSPANTRSKPAVFKGVLESSDKEKLIEDQSLRKQSTNIRGKQSSNIKSSKSGFNKLRGARK